MGLDPERQLMQRFYDNGWQIFCMCIWVFQKITAAADWGLEAFNNLR